MKVKFSIFLALVLNFFVLYSGKENKSFKTSRIYQMYSARFSEPLPDEYCAGLSDLPVAQDRVIQVDETLKSLHLEQLKTEIPSISIISSDKLSENAQLFYSVDTSWHEVNKIGFGFLCPGQIYNHILGSNRLSLNIQENPYSEYKLTNLTKRIAQVYDLSQFGQCENFLSSVEGYWKIKTSADNKFFVELNPSNLKSVKKKSKCPVFNKFAIKKYINSEFTQKHYVLVFAEPFRVYYTNATYQFESTQESIDPEVIQKSLTFQQMELVKKEIEHTLWHYFRYQMRFLLKHPGMFEMFEVQFVVDNDYFPVLYEIRNFQSFGRDKLDVKLQLSAIDLAYSVLLGMDDNYLDINLFTKI